MTSRRSNRISSKTTRELMCALCHGPLIVHSVTVAGKPVCFVCAWNTNQALAKVYGAPELTAVQRARYAKEKADKAAVAKAIPRTGREPGYVYYIRMGDAIKIGYSVDVAQRMRAYPPTAELLAAHPGTQEVERSIHLKFRADLTRGREWFNESTELLEHIAQVVQQFGDASAMAYQYTKPKTQEEKVADMFKPTRQSRDFATGTHYGGTM